MVKMNPNQRVARRRRVNRQLRSGPVFAPSVSDVMPAKSIKLRFRATNAGTVSVTLQRLLAACGAVNITGVGATWAVLHNSLKVNSISMYGAGVVGENIRLTWSAASDIYASNRSISDKCKTVSVPAYLRATPPPLEDVASWLTATSTSQNVEICRLLVSAGCVVDISLSVRQWTGLENSTPSIATTLGVAAVGDIAYISFDSTVAFTVQDLPTVI